MIVYTLKQLVGDKVHRVIVAADNKATAAKAVGMSKYAFKQKADISKDMGDQAHALTKPGVALSKPLDGSAGWRPL